jgi:hypothetical protein
LSITKINTLTVFDKSPLFHTTQDRPASALDLTADVPSPLLDVFDSLARSSQLGYRNIHRPAAGSLVSVLTIGRSLSCRVVISSAPSVRRSRIRPEQLDLAPGEEERKNLDCWSIETLENKILGQFPSHTRRPFPQLPIQLSTNPHLSPEG